MVVLDATVVNVALPSIQTDLGFTRREPPVGHQRLHARVRRLPAARRPRRRPVRPPAAVPGRRRDLLGRVAAQRARDVGGAGSSAPAALQGLGGALVSPAALSIITTTFAEGEERTKALGVWSAIAAGGGAFGLLLGGILTDLLSWEWIFFVNVPIGIATAALAIRYVPESRAPSRARQRRPARRDHASPPASSCSSTRSSRREDFGWGSAQTLGLVAVAVVLLVAFVFIERRTEAPLIRLGHLPGALARRRQPRSCCSSIGGLFAFFFFASLYVQQILGYSPLEAGLAFLPVTVGIGVGAGIAQQLVKRIGVRTTARRRHGDRRVRPVPVLAA